MLRFIFSQKTGNTLNTYSISRVSIGLFFLITGLNKLFHPTFKASMLHTITGIGFPYPQFTANFTATSEALFGLLLAIGLYTRFSAIVLNIILFVALFTFDIPNYIPKGLELWTWYSYLLYLPQVLYILFMLSAIEIGGGSFSLDSAIYKRQMRFMVDHTQ